MVIVAVGVIKSNDKVYITFRNKNQHQGNKWEFPGGKVEAGETSKQALKRELFEEVGIEVLSSKQLAVIEFDYTDKQVKLEVFVVDQFKNQPTPKESQQAKWILIKDLNPSDFPEANIEIIKKLQSELIISS